MAAIILRKVEDRVALSAGVLLSLLTLGLLRRFDPLTSGIFPPCPLHALTGLNCPGCGSLRAMHQLLQGNLRAAFAMNPLAILALPFLIYGGISWMRLQLTGKQLPRLTLPGRWIWALAVLVVIYGILRNIPVYPFNLLAPGGLLQV